MTERKRVALKNAIMAFLCRRAAAPDSPPAQPLRRYRDDHLAHAAAQAARHRAWLEAILRPMAEGVVLCGTDHRIIAHNAAAARLLGQPGQLAPGRPLFALVSREPILRALELLQSSGTAQSRPFAGATLDSRRLLQGRLMLVREADDRIAGYLLHLADSQHDAELLAQDNLLRRALARDLRQPLANLRAAAEVIAAYPGMSAAERAAFDDVVVSEAALLSSRVEILDRQFRRQAENRWLMADLHSQDLFNCLSRDAARAGLILRMVGIPLWLHGDSPSLLLALGALVADLAQFTNRTNFDLEALLSDRHVTLDVVWVGEPVPSAELEHWLDRQLPDSAGDQTVRDVLDRHGSELWSQKLRNGTTVLRIPLPAPQRPQFMADDAVLPSRPEIHDAAIMRAHAQTGPLGPRLLSELSFVVFDTETTGLNPRGGDEIVQIAAVKVLGGRVRTGESFERLVNPGRPIPPDSTRFHGITDAMVTGKPPLGLVLRQFKNFVGDDVLVAHNAAFDLGFLAARQTETGVTFTNPALDTLLLALVAEPDADPALAALAKRLSVAVDLRRSALADAMTAAEVFVRLLEILARRDIHTLDDAMAAQSAIIGGL